MAEHTSGYQLNDHWIIYGAVPVRIEQSMVSNQASNVSFGERETRFASQGLARGVAAQRPPEWMLTIAESCVI